MTKRWSILPALVLLGVAAFAQNSPKDTVITPVKKDTIIIPVKEKEPALIDTTLNYDDLFQDFDAFMDSILYPHSYFLMSLSAGKGYYNFETKNSSEVTS